MDFAGLLVELLLYWLKADVNNILQQQNGVGNPYAQQTGNAYSESVPSQGAYGNGSNGAYGESHQNLSGSPQIDSSILQGAVMLSCQIWTLQGTPMPFSTNVETSIVA